MAQPTKSQGQFLNLFGCDDPAYIGGFRLKRWRARIYQACGVGMLVSLALFAAYGLSHRHEVYILWGEALGLWSFGASWMTASRVLPFITAHAERQCLVGNAPGAPRAQVPANPSSTATR